MSLIEKLRELSAAQDKLDRLRDAPDDDENSFDLYTLARLDLESAELEFARLVVALVIGFRP